MNMKKSRIKIFISLIIFTTIICMGIIVNATNEDVAILGKQNNEYIIYLKDYLKKDFYFAFSNSENAKEGDQDYPLNFITSKEDNKGNQTAYITTENTKAPLYMWIKIEGNYVMKGIHVDLTAAIQEDEVKSLATITNRIPVDINGKTTEEVKEENKTKTITQGTLKITDVQDGIYYYSTILLSADTKDYNRLMELTKKFQENLTIYDEIILNKEYEVLFNSLVQSTNWTETKDGIIKQPETANDGDQYVVMLKKVAKGATTYDAKLLTSYKAIKQDQEEVVVSTKQDTKLPVTYDNPILFILLGVGIVLIIIIAIRIKKLSKKSEEQ